MPPLKYTPGFEIGRLTVIERRPKGHLLVECQCGNIKEVSRSNVSSGDTRSCGCLRDETLTTHGMTGTHLHNVWLNMLGRVRGQISAEHYAHVTIDESWLDFEAFARWSIENGYDEGLSLDRIRNELGYGPANCRWIPRSRQVVNRRKRPSSSKYLGVNWSKQANKWHARVQVDGQQVHVGYFDDERAAALARDRVAKELQGETAVLNFPNEQ